MAVGGVFNQGNYLLDLPFRVGPAVTSVVGGVTVNGMVPYRMVILDNTFSSANAVGDNSLAPIQFPNAGFVNGERVIGVAMSANSLPSNPPNGIFYQPIKQNTPMQVRVAGVAPVMTDSTTANTPILYGDLVAASVTANFDGTARKATIAGSHNYPTVDQHILGIAFSRVDIAGGVVLTMITPREV